MTAKRRAIQGRQDLSKFVVHLTRDDTEDNKNGDSASANFSYIIKEREIGAYNAHCMHAQKIPAKHKKKFRVACFTEVPLTQLHLLTRHIAGRKIRLEPYGIIFTREFILSKGAQPAIYINSYDNNNKVRQGADSIFNLVYKEDFRKPGVRELLPFLNSMNERYDFTWEREWRVVGGVSYEPSDVVAVVLPPDGEGEWREKFIKKGIPVISPDLSYEDIVYQFSLQQRATQQVWVARKENAARKRRK